MTLLLIVCFNLSMNSTVNCIACVMNLLPFNKDKINALLRDLQSVNNDLPSGHADMFTIPSWNESARNMLSIPKASSKKRLERNAWCRQLYPSASLLHDSTCSCWQSARNAGGCNARRWETGWLRWWQSKKEVTKGRKRENSEGGACLTAKLSCRAELRADDREVVNLPSRLCQLRIAKSWIAK